MALTRDFKETVAARVQNDPAFAQALLDEAITLFVNGESESAKLILRDLVNATVGFEALADEIHKPAKSLHRMLSKSGNPTMSNVSAIFAAIKRALKVEVRAPGRDGLSRFQGITRRAARGSAAAPPNRSAADSSGTRVGSCSAAACPPGWPG